MTWTKLGDEFGREAWKLSDAAWRLHVEALMWSNTHLLDLVIAKEDVRRFGKNDDPLTISELVDEGWWQDVGDSWFVGCRFADWQEDRTVVEKRRDDAAERKRRARLHQAGDHSRCTDRCPNVTRDSPRDGTRSTGSGRDGTGRDKEVPPGEWKLSSPDPWGIEAS